MVADLWSWLGDVVGRIGDLSVYWLLLALALKTAESAFIGLGWRNILRAAYPRSPISFRTAWGASQGGTAINAIAPAQAGTAAMIGIFRTSIEGASVAGVAAATAVQAAFFTALSVLMVICVAIFRPHTVSKGSPADEGGGFVASHPFLVPLVIVVVIVALIVFWPRLKPRLADTWHKAKAGAAIFRDWRRYLREVALPSAASYACRIGVNIVFSSHMLSGLFAITPGGVGQTQALDIATLRGRAPTGSVAAFSITQDSVMTIWNVVLGIVVMTWAFGFDSMKHMLSRRGREEARASPQA